MKYAVGGVAIIYVCNILRCTGLAIMWYHHSSLADFAHHYAFKLIIYAVAFLLWAMYSKKEHPDEQAPAAV
jgi:exosortase/archaeosortase family protein